jgi:hypothetical protein
MATTTTVAIIGDTAEVRLTTETGWRIIYKSHVQIGCKWIERRDIFRYGGLSRFGAIRALVEYKRAWHGRFFFMEIEQVEPTRKHDIYYFNASFYDGIEME